MLRGAIGLGQRWNLEVAADINNVGSAHACTNHDLVGIIRSVIVRYLWPAAYAPQVLNLIWRKPVFDVGELLVVVIIIVIVHLIDLFLQHGVLLVHMLIREDLLCRPSVVGPSAPTTFDLLRQSLVHPVGMSRLSSHLLHLLDAGLVDPLLVSSNR